MFSTMAAWQQDAQAAALLSLVAALGLSAIAGLRAYLPLLVVGVASIAHGADGLPLLPLQPGFAPLGWPVALAALGLLALIEFGADKAPGLDHVSDVPHTIIRPLAGALILGGTQNWLSDHGVLFAAVVGGLLALAVHGLKAGVRHMVSATTAGAGNAIASTVEDVIVVATTASLALAPLLGLPLLVLEGALLHRIVARLVARFKGVVGARRGADGLGAVGGLGGATPILPEIAFAPPSTPAIAPASRPAISAALPPLPPLYSLYAPHGTSGAPSGAYAGDWRPIVPSYPSVARAPFSSAPLAPRSAAISRARPWWDHVSPAAPTDPAGGAPPLVAPAPRPYASLPPSASRPLPPASYHPGRWYDTTGAGAYPGDPGYPDDAPTLDTMPRFRGW